MLMIIFLSIFVFLEFFTYDKPCYLQMLLELP